VGLSDFLEFDLDFLDALVLEILDFFEGVFDDAQSFGVDLGSGQQLVDLRVLRLEGLLDGLQFLLEDEVS